MMADRPEPLQAPPWALERMRAMHYAERWAAYENRAFDSSNFGHLQFLAIGPTCTYNNPPEAYPADTASGMGWRYRFVGWVDLETGVIRP